MRFRETDEGEIIIEGNVLHCKHKYNIYNSTVNIDKLEYVYGLINANNQALLFCFDSHQHRIPVEFKGFKKAYNYLSDILGFNNDLFHKTMNQNQKAKARIWKRDYNKNYKTIDSIFDFSIGFSIQNLNSEIIEWDRPANLFHKSDLAEFVTNEYNQECIKFSSKVKVGNIEVDDFFGHVGKRDDSPILYFTAKLRNECGDHNSYFDAKESINKLKKTDDFYSLYEREDQNSLTWERDGISKSITYWYNSEHGYESCYTSLVIRNKREYPQLYRNNEILKKNSLTSLYIFNLPLWSRDNYKEDITIKEKPKIMKGLSKGFPCVWINKDKNTIGFGGQTFCQEFLINEIESIHLQNIHPAKGSGASYLELKLNGIERRQYVLSGKYQDFDNQIKNLEKALDRKIVIEKEYADV